MAVSRELVHLVSVILSIQGYSIISDYKCMATIFPVLIQLSFFSVYIFAVNEDENQKVDIDDIKIKYRDELQALARHYLRPVSLLVLAVIGALIGSVVGSNYGVVGSGVGIVIGILVTIPVALYLINATSIARQSSVLVKERKSECSK